MTTCGASACAYYEVSRYLLGYWKALHHEPIDSIERKTIAKRLRAIIDSNGKIAASRARTALSTFFVWAMKEGLCDKEENPVTFTHDPGEGAKPRERVLKNDELRAVWNACGDDEFGRVIRLLILTGQRKMEVGRMRWDELKSGAGKWCIPGTRTKNHRDHELTLAPQAWAIIDSVSPRHGNDYLFGRKHGFTSWSTCKIALDRCSGLTGWTVHDLRRTAATRMADIGVQPHIIEAVLNHVSGHKRGVAGTYNRSPYEREVKNALAIWSDHVASIISGEERKILQFPAEGVS
jgi:integrase